MHLQFRFDLRQQVGTRLDRTFGGIGDFVEHLQYFLMVVLEQFDSVHRYSSQVISFTDRGAFLLKPHIHGPPPWVHERAVFKK